MWKREVFRCREQVPWQVRGKGASSGSSVLLRSSSPVCHPYWTLNAPMRDQPSTLYTWRWAHSGRPTNVCWRGWLGEQTGVTAEGSLRQAEERVGCWQPVMSVRGLRGRRLVSRLEGPSGTAKGLAWLGPALGCLHKGQQTTAHKPAPSIHCQVSVATLTPGQPRWIVATVWPESQNYLSPVRLQKEIAGLYSDEGTRTNTVTLGPYFRVTACTWSSRAGDWPDGTCSLGTLLWEWFILGKELGVGKPPRRSVAQPSVEASLKEVGCFESHQRVGLSHFVPGLETLALS